MNKDRINGSGCRDTVPYEAIRHFTSMERIEQSKRDEAADELINVIKTVVKLAGFELIDRIRFMDPRNGKKYL